MNEYSSHPDDRTNTGVDMVTGFLLFEEFTERLMRMATNHASSTSLAVIYANIPEFQTFHRSYGFSTTHGLIKDIAIELKEAFPLTQGTPQETYSPSYVHIFP